mmetsp:Transcript_32518/g.59640  ORF Transcript_32518/g.59640 Transcript_32518/m.59640 type:complete len:80 (+) Transcript_32518:144-383(+)
MPLIVVRNPTMAMEGHEKCGSQQFEMILLLSDAAPVGLNSDENHSNKFIVHIELLAFAYVVQWQNTCHYETIFIPRLLS